MLALLAHRTAAGCTGIAGAAAASWWRWLPAEAFSSTTPPAAAATAAPPNWHQRFAVAPGSTLRLDLPCTAADVSIRVGEHETIELSASTSATPDDRGGSSSEGAVPHSLLAAAAAVDPRREGATIGGRGLQRIDGSHLICSWVSCVAAHAGMRLHRQPTTKST